MSCKQAAAGKTLDDPRSFMSKRRAHMSKRQLGLKSTIDALLEICRLRGIGSQHLATHVKSVCTDGVYVDSPAYGQELSRAAKVTAAGLTAQLSFLRAAWGDRQIQHVLAETGGILDAIVRATSSDPDELAIDIGRDNIDANGDVI